MIDVGDTHPRTGHRWRSRWFWLALPVVLVAGGAIAAAVVLRDPAEPVSVGEDYEITLRSWEPQR